MRHLRRLHAASLILIGLAIAAWLFGSDRRAVALLIPVACINVISLEALRARAVRETRP